MDTRRDFLLEVGVEELPAGYIAPALKQMMDGLKSGLADARLAHGEPRCSATPRRLAAWVPRLAMRQDDLEMEVTGPPARVAFDASGKPTKAAEGFARSQNVDVASIYKVQTPRGEYCAVKRRQDGRLAADVLCDLAPKVLAGLSFPKSMRWPESPTPFARPVRWLVALLGEETLPVKAFGLVAGRITEGHPFLCPGKIEIPSADWADYVARLLRANVMIETQERQRVIREQIEAALAAHGGRLEEEWLLEEVTNLAQWPGVVEGAFSPEFLEVPAPAIVAAMTEHQRYFPVRKADGSLMPSFLVVTDRGGGDEDTIRRGNERVLRARLSDARFFFRQDRGRKLESYVAELDGMVYLKGLGSYRDKAARLERLAAEVGASLGLDAAALSAARRGALLCKADLVTAMVGEFPKLQGVMGEIYAGLDGEPQDACKAIAEHYMPRSADGDLPATPVGRALSLAEKIDNLCACFSMNLAPTGSADPYALRRQSQAVLRIAEASGRFFSLKGLIRAALDLLPPAADKSESVVSAVLGFLRDRLQQLALDRGLPHDLVRGALAVGADDIADYWLRLKSLEDLSKEALWPDLVAVAERTYNISKGVDGAEAPDAALFEQDEERSLWRLIVERRDEITSLEDQRRYAEAGRLYAQVFGGPVHDFFDKVFVNVEDARVRANRLRLIRAAHALYGARVADLSNISTGVAAKSG
ncbi:MAG TPA: glycine--tRNA ligase subunit beta [Candidatus Brocadiia bacterium]|mgnify:CR=1 FL=1|nr:glycine--tRNA ligase subunit beta [Candidatus Brocadiia bacterium]